MKDFIQPVLDFLFKLANKYGTKFLVALAAIGSLYYLAYAGKMPAEYAAGGITLTVIAYMVARRHQEKEKQCCCEDCENEEDSDSDTDTTG